VTNREGFLKRIPYPDARAANSDTYLNFNQADYATSSREGGDNRLTARQAGGTTAARSPPR
jgi:hypothetical protein